MTVGGWLVKLKDHKEVTYSGEGYSIVFDNSWLRVIYTWPEKSHIEKRRWLFFNYDEKIIETKKVEQAFLMAPREKVEYVKLFGKEDKDGSGEKEKNKSKDNNEETQVAKETTKL